ncbi:hypothetical protein A2686_03090 [Candidatus Woesebacteria bacterium RIFCSPHIGHO2_01_FULL_38_10]|uniref:Cell division protein FtsL n=1 Tax=Candidatus Woesebacteria bacterium RIFCSPLOWO2_01_FULL_39_10b TaxID=1802517 RepID=A0A1F8B5M7_9BACT|nr:MAG: hypothetical protein A2686_03090 [Candidatus Woesebacteria bacterium RIFCSPHIGHO2_01_FULL_38_10]OGM59307.1 MAG: hypothetical protein A2892_05595 [Candidatus Woesebacteria bacterium RIFCSPLOWO2_01_FULL_39_10b]
MRDRRKKVISQKKKILDKKNISILFLGLFIIFELVLTIKAVTLGTTLSLYEKEEERLSSENKKLSRELVQKTSLAEVEAKAKDLGFERLEKVIYLTPGDSFAGKP